ncbi:hypothetical protein LTR66_016992, partial [Elasticomyces elasticus]
IIDPYEDAQPTHQPMTQRMPVPQPQLQSQSHRHQHPQLSMQMRSITDMPPHLVPQPAYKLDEVALRALKSAGMNANIDPSLMESADMQQDDPLLPFLNSDDIKADESDLKPS